MSVPLPPAFKKRLKNIRKRIRNVYAEHFLAFTPGDLSARLEQLGVRQGDVLFVHSSLDAFAGFQGDPTAVIATLQQCVGPSGTLLMPQQPFSGSAIEWAESGKVFDVRRTPTRMGLLPELFRRMPGVSRSLHPTHSVAAWGRQAAWFIETHHEAKSPCGLLSPYMRLYEAGGKVLHLGSPFATTTFLHAADEILRDSLPFSPLTERVYLMKVRDSEGRDREIGQQLFDSSFGAVRDPDRLLPALRRNHALREVSVSRLRCMLVKTHALVETMRELAGEGIYFYDIAALKRSGHFIMHAAHE